MIYAYGYHVTFWFALYSRLTHRRNLFIISYEFTVYNSGNFISPDAGIGGVSKRAHEESDSSPGSPAPLAIVESPEPPEHQPSQSKRQRIHEMDDHWTDISSILLRRTLHLHYLPVVEHTLQTSFYFNRITRFRLHIIEIERQFYIFARIARNCCVYEFVKEINHWEKERRAEDTFPVLLDFTFSWFSQQQSMYIRYIYFIKCFLFMTC